MLYKNCSSWYSILYEPLCKLKKKSLYSSREKDDLEYGSDENTSETKDNSNSSKERVKPTIFYALAQMKNILTSNSMNPPRFFPPVGQNDLAIPITEDQPSSIIAYSLNSIEYRHKFDQIYSLQTEKVPHSLNSEDLNLYYDLLSKDKEKNEITISININRKKNLKIF